MPHEDGDAYYPVVATVSLQSPIVLDVWEKANSSAPRWRILQEPRSLLVTRGEMYAEYLHGIAAVDEDKELDQRTIANWSLLADPAAFDRGRLQRQTRISLTFRDVKKVVELGTKFRLL